MNSSNASLHCRLEWRPSRWLLGGMSLLSTMAILSLWLSALPALACAVGSMLVVAYTVVRIRREAQRAPVRIVWPGGDAAVVIELPSAHADMQPRGDRGNEFHFVALNFRASLVVLCVADEQGRRSRWTWWPDTLDARGRRALRFAASVQSTPVLTQPPLSTTAH